MCLIWKTVHHYKIWHENSFSSRFWWIWHPAFCCTAYHIQIVIEVKCKHFVLWNNECCFLFQCIYVIVVHSLWSFSEIISYTHLFQMEGACLYPGNNTVPAVDLELCWMSVGPFHAFSTVQLVVSIVLCMCVRSWDSWTVKCTFRNFLQVHFCKFIIKAIFT